MIQGADPGGLNEVAFATSPVEKFYDEERVNDSATPAGTGSYRSARCVSARGAVGATVAAVATAFSKYLAGRGAGAFADAAGGANAPCDAQ